MCVFSYILDWSWCLHHVPISLDFHFMYSTMNLSMFINHEYCLASLVAKHNKHNRHIEPRVAWAFAWKLIHAPSTGIKFHEFHKLDNRSHGTFDINFVQCTFFIHENRNTNQMFWAWNAHRKNYLIILKCNYIFIWTNYSLAIWSWMRISRDKNVRYTFRIRSLLQWTSDGLNVNFCLL